MTSSLPISVVIVASNEALRIERCLASVRDWVPEIVVALNNSTDATEAIALRHGARVEHVQWRGYRDTKNMALGFALEPWALILDADEEVSPQLRMEIAGFFSGDHERFAGAYFARKTWFIDRWICHGDWYPDYCLRLFRRDAGRCGGGHGHDKIEVVGSVKRLRGDLYHYSFPTLTSHVEKINVFAAHFLRSQLETGKRWRLLPSVLRPFWRFVRAYILRSGWRDGYPGFYIAWATAFGALVRYSMLYEHERSRPPKPDA